jgi:hypothetical protein
MSTKIRVNTACKHNSVQSNRHKATDGTSAKAVGNSRQRQATLQHTLRVEQVLSACIR